MKGLVKHYLAAVPVSGFMSVVASVETEFVEPAFAVDLKTLNL